ncbi:hypothetical protein M431DRAFT_502197 [Trichoderma harzianum CBS 226.95]|uniref:Uncharacterized protein n=1 Tax=Trichoderma harzianum CBS 226.95 TaxID=983964 RepID=A0A2T4ASL8_TRIHA|nr:hypothetical protein M431DRAFT_502197 [Trichoderma harzianum CBS 226.95]PTB60055.1 hypothetical protein M431DRAFT_502197 [Trichoderma harzianum CBS 226.95]
MAYHNASIESDDGSGASSNFRSRLSRGCLCSVLEIPSMGALESLGKHAAQGLLKLNDEEAS